MDVKEITLNELQSKTGFTKKQIYNWRKKGLIPEPVRRERTGRVEGEIVYYPIEAYHRLKNLKAFPISSVTKRIGIDALFLPLFLYEFRDDKIDEGIKRLLKKAYQHFRKEFIQIQKDKTLEELSKETEGNNLFFPGETSIQQPFEMILPLMARLAGTPKKEIKEMLPEDTSDEKYDKTSEYVGGLREIIENKFEVKGYDEFEDDFLKAFRLLATKLPSLKDLNEEINTLSKKNLTDLQLGMLMRIGWFGIIGLESAQALPELFKKTHFIYEFCLSSLYTLFSVNLLDLNFNPKIKNAMNELSESIKQLSLSEHEVKEKRGRKKDSQTILL